MVNAQLPDAASLRAHRCRHEEGGSHSREERGHRGFQHHQRLLAADLRLLEHGFLLRPAQASGKRATEEAHADGVVAALNRAFAQRIPDGAVIAFGPPSIPGLGTGAGFTMQLQDRSGGSPDYLAEQTRRFMDAARKRPRSDVSTRCIGRPSPDLCGHRSQQGAEVRRSVERREHDLGAARQLVRERLQPVRPRLQGM